nr:hypothetical protein [uncultured Desulfosarcina sp.]
MTTATDGKRYRTKFYNLQAIIAVGYRVTWTLWTDGIEGETRLNQGGG